MTRLILGFFTAALWLPLLAYILDSTYYGEFWAFAIAFYTVPLTIFVALPAYFLVRKRISFLLCVGMGCVIGVIGAFIFFLVTNPLAAMNWAPGLISAGIMSSIVFWVIAIWKNKKLMRNKSEPK